MSPPGIELNSLTKVFPNGVRAVDELNLEVGEGEFFALLGPSGCGKTTLLRMIAGLEAPSTGQILISGRDVTRLAPGKRDVTMVFQDYALYPHMTVLENIAYPLKVRKLPKSERTESARSVAAELKVDQLLERRPGQLSGGQQQRVAVARAIAYESGVFLFDEPLSNLDARLRLEARTFLKRLQKQLGVTTLYVTHDQSEALALADRVAVMREGRIVQLAPAAEVYRRPSSLFVASFIGSIPMNLLPAEVHGGKVVLDGVRLPLPREVSAYLSDGDPLVVGARPELATLGSEKEGIGGRVTVVELLGNDYLVTVERNQLTVQATAPYAPDMGEKVGVILDPSHLLFYYAEDGRLVGSRNEQ